MERARKANSEGDFVNSTFRKTQHSLLNKASTGQLISLPKEHYRTFN